MFKLHYDPFGKVMCAQHEDTKDFYPINGVQWNKFLEWNSEQGTPLSLEDKVLEPVSEPTEITEAKAIIKKSKLTEDDRDTLLKLLVEKILK